MEKIFDYYLLEINSILQLLEQNSNCKVTIKIQSILAE